MKCFFLLYLLVSTKLLSQTLLIRHVNIIDVKTGAVYYNQIVDIKGNQIASIANDGNKQEEKSGTEIDCTNKYLIPGLWDMHLHDIGTAEDTRQFIIPILLANGVTG